MGRSPPAMGQGRNDLQTGVRTRLQPLYHLRNQRYQFPWRLAYHRCGTVPTSILRHLLLHSGTATPLEGSCPQHHIQGTPGRAPTRPCVDASRKRVAATLRRRSEGRKKYKAPGKLSSVIDNTTT